MDGQHYALPPRHVLFPFVQGIWELRIAAPYWRQRVLPTGVVDLLFPLEGTLTVTETRVGDRSQLRAAPFLAGLQRGAVVSETRGAMLLLGVSLRAEASRAILPCPVHEVSDLTIPAGDVLANCRELFGRLYEARTFRDRCGVLLRWLAPLVRSSAQLARFTHACGTLTRACDAAALDRAATVLGCSSRHLRRTFLNHVGTSPAEYLRLRRFIRSVELMQPSRTLTDIAHDAGYYDQAHFCRDFKDFAGVTPGEYRRQVGPVPGILFSTDVRLIQAPETAIA